MELFYLLLILLLTTRVFGEVATRFGQPVLAGELLAGVVLGVLIQSFTRAFPVLAELAEDRVFHAITDLGIFFLMLLAGIEMRPRDLTRASKTAFAVAAGGMLLPMALGVSLAYWMLPESDWKFAQMLYLGVALSVTAVPITVATLLDLGQARTTLGTVIVSAAVFDDLMSLFLLAVLTSVLSSGSAFEISSLAVLAGKVVVFFLVTAAVGKWLFPIVGRFAQRLQIPHIEFSTLVAWALAFAVLAELLDMHFVLGAYAAGLFFTRRTMDKEIHKDLHVQIEVMTLGFFAPIFFASIGLNIDLSAITAIPGFLVLLIAAAFAGKLLGAGTGALAAGMSRRDALAVGVGMNARGAVELIIAGIALDAGLFSHPQPTPPVVSNLFSAVVLMAICAAVLSPLALRSLLKRQGQRAIAARQDGREDAD